MARTAATSIGVSLLVSATITLSVYADEPFDRLMGAVSNYAEIPENLRKQISLGCGLKNLECAADRISSHLGPFAKLIQVQHPHTDSIRRSKTEPSVTTVRQLEDNKVVLVLDKFGRKADREIVEAIAKQIPKAPLKVTLDLRNNQGGDFDRMCRVASLFTGAHVNVVRLIGRHEINTVSLLEPASRIEFTSLDVLIGPKTASSAEVLAALLRRYAGAKLIGSRTKGKNRLTRVISVTHDWRLLISGERIDIPGLSFAGGVMPDIVSAESVENRRITNH